MSRQIESSAPKAHFPRWAAKFDPSKWAKYKVAYGGRGSGKTVTVARLIVAEAAHQPLRVACCRAVQASIKQSTKQYIEAAIRDLGLQDKFDIRSHEIYGKNGSFIFFHGLENMTESIRGWANVNRVWVDEAHAIRAVTAKVLIPTIRDDRATFYFTFNPKYRTDWVYRRFVMYPRPDDVIEWVNYDKNPWFPRTLEEERRTELAIDPESYKHIWLGHPDDEGNERQMLPFGMLQVCVDACKKMPREALDGPIDVGLDVADGGPAFNAMATRRGALLDSVSKWKSHVTWRTAHRADTHCRDIGARRLNYDTQGVGAGVKSELNRIGTRPYRALPVSFGEAVRGPEKIFTYKVKNSEFFMRRNAQLGWAVRIRAENTRKFIDGESMDPRKCLFINPDIPRIEELLGEMSQPTWRENELGKVTLTKRDETEASPDLYDAVVLAFARDSEHGLARRT